MFQQGDSRVQSRVGVLSIFSGSLGKFKLVTFRAAGVRCLTQRLAGNNSPGRSKHESEEAAQSTGRRHRVNQLEKTERKKRKDDKKAQSERKEERKM